MSDRESVRVGGASGSWGDSPAAVPQLLAAGVNYLVFDFLAELTMSLLASAQAKDPKAGYATDFVQIVAENLPAIMAQNVKVISNAGGVNPRACAAVLKERSEALGLTPRIAVVTGDDATLALGDAAPATLRSANAYLGAIPIATALSEGADIVITGRCVDSAVTLGALMYEFAWSPEDLDKLAQGSLAGHIIECGTQATGGIFTDWEQVQGWDDMGYPIVEVAPAGDFILTKPAGTGGLIASKPAAEQVLYEVGDPGAYILPDVVCDFRNVRLEQVGPQRLHVSGAKGLPPTDSYKVSMTYQDGYRAHLRLTVIGFDADRKAQRIGEAILARASKRMVAAGFADFDRTRIEILGAESCYGPHARVTSPREVVLRLSVVHKTREALAFFGGEIGPSGMSYASGVTGLGARPKPAPNLRLDSCLIPKSSLTAMVEFECREIVPSIPEGVPFDPHDSSAVPPEPSIPADWVEVPLISLAHGRSGDKGDSSNIAIFAREARFLPYLRDQLTPGAVKTYMAHLVKGAVQRYEAPGLMAFNFLCDEALDGGVAGSLHNDPWGKGYAQILLTMPVRVHPDLKFELEASMK